MNVRNFTNKLVLGTSLLATTACKEVRHELPKTSTEPVIELVDKFSKSKMNQIDTTGLELFKVDTLEISEKLLSKPEKLMQKMKKLANWSNPEEPDGMTIGYGVGMKMNGRFGTGLVYQQQMVPIYEPKSIKVHMQNKVYANKDNSKFFVPVDYYGKRIR